MVIAVINRQTVELDLVGNEHNRVASQLISRVEGRYCGLSIDNDFAREVDIVEGAGEACATIGMTRDMTEERFGEIVHEVDIGAMSIYGKVDGVMHGRDVALDMGLRLRTIVGNGLYVNLLGLLIPLGMSTEYPHAPLLELEVADIEIGRGRKLSEDR